MKPLSKLAGRAALAVVSVAILVAAAGCSITFGTVSDSPTAQTAASDSPSDAATSAATTAGASAICTDLSTEDQVDFTDVQASLDYWGQVVADAPADIADQAQAVLDGFNKISDGMSPDDEENNNAINDAINSIESWSIDNCPN